MFSFVKLSAFLPERLLFINKTFFVSKLICIRIHSTVITLLMNVKLTPTNHERIICISIHYQHVRYNRIVVSNYESLIAYRCRATNEYLFFRVKAMESCIFRSIYFGDMKTAVVCLYSFSLISCEIIIWRDGVYSNNHVECYRNKSL